MTRGFKSEKFASHPWHALSFRFFFFELDGVLGSGVSNQVGAQ